jgi:FKBP-type peptidyl-prolyl cis-trans isomerase FklB
MKVLLSGVLALALIAGCESTPEVNEVQPSTSIDSASYAIGMQLGGQFKQQLLEINPEALAAGVRDAMADKGLFADTVLQRVMMSLQEKAMKKMQDEMTKKADSAKTAGTAWLEKNKQKPGVKVTSSGLQYYVIKEGTGPKPQPSDKVKVHYTGTLIDGKVFDSSVQRGEPVEFPLANVIPGWQEALLLMPVGSKYSIAIPSNLAYGDQGAGERIPPGSTLLFEVELLDIVK